MERSTSFDRTDVLCGLWSENVCSPGKQWKESSTVYLFSILKDSGWNTLPDTAQKRVQDLEKLLCRIYEDNILGKLPDERYAVLDGQYSKEQKELSAEIAEMEAELSGYEEEKLWLKKQNFKNTAEDAYTG